uniref:Secreted protein n=1 Tax=Knipowitschia caucasica TaxID=637954 RepID=A0AAV2KFW1_KNICA
MDYFLLCCRPVLSLCCVGAGAVVSPTASRLRSSAVSQVSAASSCPTGDTQSPLRPLPQSAVLSGTTADAESLISKTPPLEIVQVCVTEPHI